MIKENVLKLFDEIKNGNNYGEQITIVAATKMRTESEIKEAIHAGICNIGENRVDEFCKKLEIDGANKHFIGHLQTNKIKFIIGKTYLIHSLDRMSLARELSKRALNENITVDTLMQINIGEESTKGGFNLSECESALNDILKLGAINVKGLMAMLPYTDDYKLLEKLCLKMRTQFENFRKNLKDFKFLSMGMSHDYKIAINCGSNMVRLGSVLFGERDY